MSTPPIHLVLLELTDPSRAGEHMDGHNRWIDAGFDEGRFAFTGTVPGRGGAVLVRGLDRAAVDRLVALDPFVEHGVAVPTVVEVVPSRVDDALVGALG